MSNFGSWIGRFYKVIEMAEFGMEGFSHFGTVALEYAIPLCLYYCQMMKALQQGVH
jgi:hypothetical protein